MEVEVPTKKLGGSRSRTTLLHTQLLLCVVHAATNSCGPGLAFVWAPSITDDVVHGRLEAAHTSAIASFRAVMVSASGKFYAQNPHPVGQEVTQKLECNKIFKIKYRKPGHVLCTLYLSVCSTRVTREIKH